MANEHQTICVGGQWELRVPVGWDFAQNRQAFSIFKEVDGVGAVTVSYLNVRRQENITPAVIADEFSRGLGSAIPVPAPHANALAAESSFERNGKYWMVYVAISNHVAIVLSYNCKAADAGAEIADVRSIIQSLKDAKRGMQQPDGNR